MDQTNSNQPEGAANAAEVIQDSPTDILHFEKWLTVLGERGATDLHLTVGSVPALRVGGLIEQLDDEDVLTNERMKRIVDHLLDAEEQAVLEKERSVIGSRTLKKILRFRVHVFYSRDNLAVSLRSLSGEEKNWRDLGLPEAVGQMGHAGEGLFIITGPFDSGKTATLRSLLAEINHNEARYIVTLEQPIEYILASDKSVVIQRQVGRDVPSFSAGLASLQNEDVNVVAVSALPDSAAVSEALKLAVTGRFVIIISGSRTTVGALETLRDLFAEQDREQALSLLADALVGAVAQILLPKVGGGRVLITEVLQASAPVKSLIRDNKLRQIYQIMQTSREQGMITMDRSLVDAVKNGAVTHEAAREHAIDPNQFNLLASH